MTAMKNSPKERVCPRCDYPLLPVHVVDGRRRRVVALTCPEPYCDHIEFIGSGSEDTRSRHFEAQRRVS